MVVSIVLPCYNPPKGWEQTVYINYLSFCKRLQASAELILVIDGLGTEPITNSLTFLKKNLSSLKIIEYQVNKGKGYAIRQGVNVAIGDVIIYTDIDFPYSEDSLYTVYEALCNNECDIAVGIKNELYYNHVPFLRVVISKMLRVFIRIFLSIPIIDTQCGLKGFKKNMAIVFQQTTIDRYLFDLEFIYNSFKSKRYRIKAIPVSLKETVHFRNMNYRILFSESVNFIKILSQR